MTKKEKSITYKDTGVDIHAGNEFVNKLPSIVNSTFDKNVINFDFHHLVSSNSTFIDKDFEEKKKNFDNFRNYEKFFEKEGIYIDQNKRLKIINRNFSKILYKRALKINSIV